jgi:hypothetical protein
MPDRRPRDTAGVGSLALGAALAGVVVYLALAWAPKVPLLAMIAGTHGAMALIAMCLGVVTISMRTAVSAGQLVQLTAPTRVDQG